MLAASLRAADDPWIVLDADILAEIKTLSAVVTTVNKDIQENKAKFSNRDLGLWHEFVNEWTTWKSAYLAGPVYRATSGAWNKAKDFKRRALEWVALVNKKLGVTTPGLPRPPASDVPVWGSAMAWGLVGVLALVSGGYFVRSFGVASIARAKAEGMKPKPPSPKKETNEGQ